MSEPAWVPLGAAPLAPAWQAYSPSMIGSGGNPANVVVSGRYIVIGKLVYLYVKTLFGSTSTPGSGNYFWTTPSGLPIATANPIEFYGTGQATDFSPGGYTPLLAKTDRATNRILGIRADVQGVVVGAGLPYVWADNDTIELMLAYETP